jgi:LuxR family transcriptional regulator, maltose regulon positive regulatory protein
MTDVLCTSTAPTLASRAFRRTRLTGQLDTACERTITLICAPPGTGKTTLASDWAASRPDLSVVWFNMDVRGNDLGALCDELTVHLERLGQLATAHGTVSAGSNSLADRLARSRAGGADIVVVLDDAQEITDRSMWRDLHRLSVASPSWLHWIIVTRADPPLGVQRLQLQGRLAQIRVTDLAFDVEEATAFMAWFGLDIPADAVRGLVRWSEGWAAALCLAARTMLSEGVETRPWERLGASESLVVDFLIEEVLDRLTPADRRFLLRTSAADVLTPELAALLTGNNMAGERLHRLERAGTFLLHVDSSGKNYRYHGMMAALLRARLNDQMPTEARHLVSTAARWYSEHGYLDEAERLAARIGEWHLVGQLRAKRCGDHLIRTGSLLAMPGSPTSGPASPEPAMQLLAIVEAMRQRDRRTTELALAKGSQAIDVSESPPAVLLLRELLMVEQARWMPIPGSPKRSPMPRTMQHVEDPAARDALSSYVLVREGEAFLAGSREKAARQCFDEVAVLPGAPEWARCEADAILAVMDAAAGDPDRATSMSRCSHSSGAADADAWGHLATAIAHGLRGEMAGLRNRAEELTSAVTPRSWLLEQCTRMLIGITAWRPPSIAPSIAPPPPPGLPSSVAVALGVVETIDRQGRACAIGGSLEHTIAVARRALADASLRQLDSCLAPWRDVTTLPQEHPRSVVELNVLFAIAELRHERETSALEWIDRAIALAAPAALWGPVLARERDLRVLLERHSWELGASNSAAIEMLDNLRADHASPVAVLTDRERVVLHYLPTLMSNTEIAAEMFVSVNTVKTHLKSIYRKLGVERRRDALLRARQVELL